MMCDSLKQFKSIITRTLFEFLMRVQLV